ncbi:MAG TPA: hypothetical protein VIQ30_07530 [Pseudonocardia sp.]
MGPEFAQFLSGMRKTMEQVVLPNLSDRFAQEQAGIVVATLGFLEQVHDKVFHYELLENDRYKHLLGQVLDVVGTEGLSDDVTAAADAARAHREADPPGSEVHLRPYHDLRASNETMKEQLCELIRLQPQMPDRVRKAFDELLRPFFHDLQLRERSWVKPLGFDASGADLPEIGELLYSGGRLRLADGS